MTARHFFQFISPSLTLMLVLMAAPLFLTGYLSVRNCSLQMELVKANESTPFGTQEILSHQAKIGSDGKAVQNCQFVGLDYYKKVLGLNDDPASKAKSKQPQNEFFGALQFTLIYVFTTLPFVLAIGLLLALGVNSIANQLKGLFVSASLLPFIITPVVAALSIKWLFRDNGLIPHLLSQVGVQVFWMAEAWSARLLIIFYGIWHVVPFAFIVLYAGLQSVPEESLEAAELDGATRWQKLRFVTIPHLIPLIVFLTLIHMMDAYRVFEPVMVLTQGAFTASVQYLTYFTLLQENNPYKASAAAVLTLIGILILLIPLLVKTYREQRGSVG
jgi:multiple sugar transport system permease protein